MINININISMNIHNWILANLPKNSVIIEAGCCNATDTLFFANHFSEGKIYGFEPYPNYYKLACEKTKLYSNVEILPYALSSETGNRTFYLSDLNGSDWGSSSLLKPKEHLEVHPAITFKNQINVDTINLDDWYKTKNIGTVNLMWLDLQGSEPDVLMNAPIILKNTKYLYTEVSLIETYENVMLWNEFRLFLETSGFQVIGEELPWKDMGNVLLFNKNL